MAELKIKEQEDIFHACVDEKGPQSHITNGMDSQGMKTWDQ